MIGDFIVDNLGWILFLIFAAFVVSIAAGMKQESDTEKHFMSECLKDHKEYECVAMWRAGDQHTAVVPIFLPSR